MKRAFLFSLWVFSTPLAAQDQTPSQQGWLDAAAAVQQGDGPAASVIAAESAPLTRDLIHWLQYRDADTAPDDFPALVALLNARPNWPGLSRIRAAAERSMDDTVAMSDRLAFFDGHDVETGQGAVAYAQALTAAGRADDAMAMITQVWTTTGLDEDGFQAIIDAYPNWVMPHHAARADMLLWRWRSSDAARLLPFLDEGHRALVSARLAYINRDGDVAERVALVPARLRDDPGLAYDRFNWLADRGDWTDATALLLDRSDRAAALGIPWRWGSWRRILARWNMREGKSDLAYQLAASHHIASDQSNYADLEWLAGYIALTYDQDAARALTHFAAFDGAVTTPISRGRAGYWLGRAHDMAGDAPAALAAFRAGAQHQTSFYGLLSAEHLGLTLDPDLVGGEDFGDWRAGPLLRNDLVRAGLLLLQAGERGAAVLFFRDAAKDLPRQQLGQLGAMMMELDEPFYTLLAAKTALRANDLLVQDAYFPLHPMAEIDLPVDPALALAIARQESEFRTDAGSSVGALGLMQLMPGTARDVAGWLDLPYSRGRLTRDWTYNATLGAEYLAYLQREFGDSPVMIAAGYNAGPARPSSWMADRGDPRAGLGRTAPVDIIDWIEHIPFRETRNYVMRVSEGLPIYRARLSGQIGPVRFRDLLQGTAPLIRPVMRPPGLAPLTRSLRPQARPTGG